MLINPAVYYDYEILQEKFSQEQFKLKCEAVEELLRAYTNNNFQNRRIRAKLSSSDVLHGEFQYFTMGDTIEITDSINEGLYVIENIDGSQMTLDKPLYECACNLVTKVEYPLIVIDGAIKLILWEVENADRVGVASETISRHTVSYFNQDANNQLLGYPISLVGFLKPYIKARF